MGENSRRRSKVQSVGQAVQSASCRGFLETKLAVDDARVRPYVSIVGVTAMIVGLSVVATEFRYGLLLAQLGFWARILLFVASLSLSVWGLKVIIAGWSPRVAARSIRARRNRFMLPVEGQVYGVIMFVLFCGSAIGRSNTLLLVFALMAGPFIMNGWITFSMLKRLSVRRTVPRRVMAGEPFSVELELINPKRWLAAWLMSVRDQVGNGREELYPEVLFTRVPRHSSDTGHYQLRLSQRGRYSFGRIQVNTRFPLGLVERGLVLNEPAEILVYPRIGRFTSTWRRQLLSAAQLVSHAHPRGGSYDDDFHRIREYRPGDDPRAIHWRTSARRDELMVREFRESRDRHLILLLDLYVPSPASEAARQHAEFAISLAATICHEQMLNSRGTQVYFAANGAAIAEWNGSSQHGGREQLLDLLALLQPSSQADLRSLLDAARRQQTPQSRTVLVTTTPARATQWDQLQSSLGQNGDSFMMAEPAQLIVADREELAGVFSLS